MSRKKNTTGNAVRICLDIFGSVGKVMFVVLVVLLIYKGITQGYRFGYAVFDEAPAVQGEAVEKTITIPENPTAASVAKVLRDNGLIEDKNVFVVQYILFECEPKPGTYTLSTSMSSKKMIQYLNKAGDEDDSK